MSQQQHIFRYRNFTIFKDQILGHGSYGAVYKARCDQLMCAAKVLHPTIVDPYDPGSGKILERFQQECDFLNLIRHPHIVQYLGVYRDPESNLPVLLMELLDSSLTKMLERSPHPISYHIQVDLCNDISLAIAYLHSNGIIHRDLSGNNVLVIAGRRAKVTDFGMSKLARSERLLTPLTLCPGTLGYMSPETLKEPPRYTEKLDVFSQGVIMIQVYTRQFPDPGPALKEVYDPRSPTGTIHVPVLEPERRKKHIDLIDPTHPLLPIATACLEYREGNRPSAEELCQRLAALKENQEYIESNQTQATPVVNRTLQQERDELARQVEEKAQEIADKDEQVAEYQQEIATKDEQIATQSQEIAVKNEEIAAKNYDLSIKSEQIAANGHENDRLRIQLFELNQKLADNQEAIAQFQGTNQQLQKQISDLQSQISNDTQHQSKVVPKPKMIVSSRKDPSTIIELKWRYGGKVPFKNARQGLVLKENVVFFASSHYVYSFDTSTRKWNTRLPSCPQRWGSLAIVQGLLTMVGGQLSDKLVSLANTGYDTMSRYRWIEQFPPMPTSRHYTTATTYQKHLIVTGGSKVNKNLDKVEVLNTDTLVWSTAASLPHPFSLGSATICGDRLYLLGGNDKQGACKSVFSCLFPELLQSCHQHSLLGRLLPTKSSQSGVWQCISDTPMYRSTCATVHEQLIAVGGRDDSYKKTSAVYKYDPTTQSWNIISYMTTARHSCYVAVVENELIVVSGYGEDSFAIDSIEIASFLNL